MKVFLAMILYFAAIPVLAQEESDTKAAAAPEIQVTATPNGDVSHFSDLYVDAQLRSESAMDIQCVRALLSGVFAEVFTGDKDSSCPDDDIKSACTILGAGSSSQGLIEVSCLLPNQQTTLQLLTSRLMLLGPQKVKITLIVVPVDPSRSTTPTTTDVDLAINPPKVAVAYGGFFGSLLVGVFLLLRERVQRPLSPKVPTISRTAALGYSLRGLRAMIRLAQQALTGGIVALVIILLARGSEGLQPPIAISVQDFWGGTLIGLFSVPLSEWVYNLIRTLPTKQ